MSRRFLASFDYPTFLAALLLSCLGIVMVASATSALAGREDLWKAQALWLLVACVAATIVMAVDYRIWAEFSLVLHGIAVLLLIVVLFLGREVGGNRSWLEIGPLRFQPSELAKWTTCLVSASYLAERVHGFLRLRKALELGFLVSVPMVLVALQPDLGTALIFLPIYGAALLLGGLRWRVILTALLLVALAAPLAWNHLKDYQKERILTVFDPSRDPSGIGYQVRQSKIAIGSGQLLGKGLFQGTQSHLNFLPAQHTDFIFSVLAEEHGFIGVVAVLGLFYFIVYRAILAAGSSQDRLGTYLALLVAAWIVGQLAINIGMALGLLPTIGVPLPLVSYGGTALVAALCGVALIVNVRSRRFVN